jgi:hypothetical protein
MITNNGKTILAKYLIGQTPSYASHIAIGCGAKPRNQLTSGIVAMVATAQVATITTSLDHDFIVGDKVTISGTGNANIDGYRTITGVGASTFTFVSLNNVVNTTGMDPTKCTVYLDSSYKESLDFEMFRVPIISRGYVVEDNVSNVVFTAELPTDDRYEISEIGIYSAAANPSAGSADSKILYSFSTQENWERHTSTEAKAVETITKSLDDGTNKLTPASPTTNIELPVFQANSDNTIFTSPDRVKLYERGRFLNNSVFIVGNDATIADDFSVSGNHIHLNGTSLTLDYNVSTDKLKFAFSVVNKQGANPQLNYTPNGTPPKAVRLLVQFVSTEKSTSGVEYANFEIEKIQGIDGTDFTKNRYFVAETTLGDLVKSSGFTWGSVSTIKIYASVFLDEGTPPIKFSSPSSNYYVSLDSIRLENVSSINPLYGLTGYSPIQNTNAELVVKQQNTTNFVEFKFGFGSG